MTPTCESVKLEGDALFRFAFAGNAILTVESHRTGTRFTFKVHRADTAPSGLADQRPWFVSVLTGPDNGSDYSFLGTQFVDGEYRHGRKSRIADTAPSAVAAAWLFPRLYKRASLADVTIYHEGKCGRCGRRLTVPESILSGIGPECAKLV